MRKVQSLHFKERKLSVCQSFKIYGYKGYSFINFIGVCFGITDFVYWLFITDLSVIRECTGMGVGKALVAKPFYEKIGMTKPDDVMVYNHVEWTDFVVE